MIPYAQSNIAQLGVFGTYIKVWYLLFKLSAFAIGYSSYFQVRSFEGDCRNVKLTLYSRQLILQRAL